jgi:hypothetical protein
MLFDFAMRGDELRIGPCPYADLALEEQTIDT